MKHFGTGLFTIGIGLCAAFGAQLSQPMYDMKKEQGRLLSYEQATLKSNYESALKKTVATETSNQKLKPKPRVKDYDSETAYLSALTARHNADVASMHQHSDQTLESLRKSWLAARKAALAQTAKLAFMETPGPNIRLTKWMTDSGMGFGAGFVLMVLGALIARRVKKAELTETASDSQDGLVKTINVRVLVAQVAEQVNALAEQAKANHAPTIACADEIRHTIERLAISHFQPIVDARYRLQAEIGLAAFAEAFGPFSAGERNVSRAWSALVDEHWPEAVMSLSNAAMSLRAANQKLS
mgnify:CR=1 FL=1